MGQVRMVEELTREECLVELVERGCTLKGAPVVYNLRRGELQANKAHGADELTFLRDRLRELRELDG